jgi:hypothetical protein
MSSLNQLDQLTGAVSNLYNARTGTLYFGSTVCSYTQGSPVYLIEYAPLNSLSRAKTPPCSHHKYRYL